MADGEVYAVDGVHGWKVEDGQHTYAIKWTDYGYDQMTYVLSFILPVLLLHFRWEPLQHLFNIHDLLHQLHNTLHQTGPTHTISGPGYWFVSCSKDIGVRKQMGKNLFIR